jgi:DNA-binding MarR family transcriptional regulator
VGAVDTDDAIRSINESFDRIANGARRTIRRAASRLAGDLQPAAWPVFREVVRGERVQASAIVASLGMDKSAVSRHVKELREHGLVDAERDAQDARIIWITPTPLALARVAEVMAEQQAILRATFTSWSADDLERLAVLLERFSLPAEHPQDRPRWAGQHPSAAGMRAGEEER